MPRSCKVPQPGVKKAFPLNLPAEIALDLHVFCEIQYGATRTRVICEAVSSLIAHELSINPVLQHRFAAAKSELLRELGGKPRIVKLQKSPEH